MRKALPLPKEIERGRFLDGPYASQPNSLHGSFLVMGPCGVDLIIISSGRADTPHHSGWEHVSVSCRNRTPNWEEMCWVKDVFWDSEELVVQFHPPESDYVNNHPNVLHLWRPIDGHIKLPPSLLVGIKKKGILTPEQAEELRKGMEELYGKDW